MPEIATLAPLLLIAGLALLVLPRLDPDRPWPRLIGAALTALLLARYMAWRVTETMPPPEATADSVLAALFLAVEMLSCLGGLVLLHVLSRTRHRGAEADAHPVESHPGGPPLIDVLIPTYNEAREILLRSIVGALAQDYPRFRVWVLDDGRRPWLREMAAELGAGYLTREDNAHAKAGNMNAALRKLSQLPDRAELVAVLDADFVPTPHFLRRAAALFHDPKVGCVQTPQHFFNPDPIQLNLKAPRTVADEQRFFFDVILPAKDAHGTAFSCGTSGLVRLRALEEVGFFPHESVTEDMLLSIKLKAAGWETAYLNERLTAGLAPEGMQEYLTQRGRWCLGAMQIMRTRWGPFSAAPMPWRMRLHTLDTGLFWSVGSLTRAFSLLVPMLYWWFGTTVIDTDLEGILWHLGPYWLCSALFIGWISRGTHLPVIGDAIGLLVLREALRASMAGLFGRRDQKFKVTAKGARRDAVVVQWSLVGPFLALALATIGGVAWRAVQGPIPGVTPGLEAMNLFWSVYNCLALLLACLICTEQPRLRREERFDADEPALLRHDGIARPERVRLRDLSIIGARVEREPRTDRDGAPAERDAAAVTLAPGQAVTLSVPAVGEVPAEVRRISAAGLHLAFRAAPREQAALIRKVFSGSYVHSVQATAPLALLGTLLARALR